MAARSESAEHPGDGPQQRKVLLSVDDDLKTRMKWTIEHTRARTGITTQQMFIRVAIEDLCLKLEKQYNGGKPFPKPADARTR